VRLTRDSLSASVWKGTGVELPQFDVKEMVERTMKKPTWIHIAPGNLYVGEIAPIQEMLLESGSVREGIIGVETWDEEIVDKIYRPHDNLRIRVVMPPKGDNQIKVLASTAGVLFADPARPKEWEKVLKYFTEPSLQIVTITCTEKGYRVRSQNGEVLEIVMKDIKNGPAGVEHIMGKIAAFAYARYKAGSLPIAFVSMDNCSRNGKRLFEAVSFIAREWVSSNNLVDEGFLKYLESEKVSFPWTMIDRITPRPSESTLGFLKKKTIQDMDIIRTQKNTFVAPFANTEHISYLVIEDNFPNGRPPMEKADTLQNRVIFVETAEIVDGCEKMKVGTCLNPVHTTLATLGCVLGYEYIYEEMMDPLLKGLVYKQTYEESMPVVAHPGVIDPKEFLRQVLEERLVNPNIPDTPQRIATDTSQKVGVRYGETIKTYGKKAGALKYIPLAIAGWCRYLLGIDDKGKKFELSPDPVLEELKVHIDQIQFGKPESTGDRLKPILSNIELFGLDLYSVGVGEKIEEYFKEMIHSPGAVKRTLQKNQYSL